MNRMTVVVLFLAASSPAPAADPVPLFNGTDLTGWVNVNCAPGTFVVKDGVIVTNGRPTGYLRTVKQYENFVLDFDWMHVREQGMANSGLFVWGDPLPAVGTGYTRGIEVQVLINFAPADGWATSHGDLFSIWGAKCTPDRPHPKGIERCLPSENRVKGAGQWNHYTVIANDGVLKLEVNGKEVSGVSKSRPRKGNLALESEGSECHFKNLTIQELPSTNPKPEECADVWGGHVSLFDGLTFDGWKAEKTDWAASDGVIRAKGKTDLVFGKDYTHYELIFDWKLPEKSKDTVEVVLGKNQVYSYSSVAPDKSSWQRVTLAVTKDGVTMTKNGLKSGAASYKVGPGPIAFKAASGLELRNLFLNDLSAK